MAQIVRNARRWPRRSTRAASRCRAATRVLRPPTRRSPTCASRSRPEAAQTLERANIIVNKNLIPGDRPEDWDFPGGMRIGTIEVTRFGMKERRWRRSPI